MTSSIQVIVLLIARLASWFTAVLPEHMRHEGRAHSSSSAYSHELRFLLFLSDLCCHSQVGFFLLSSLSTQKGHLHSRL